MRNNNIKIDLTFLINSSVHFLYVLDVPIYIYWLFLKWFCSNKYHFSYLTPIISSCLSESRSDPLKSMVALALMPVGQNFVQSSRNKNFTSFRMENEKQKKTNQTKTPTPKSYVMLFSMIMAEKLDLVAQELLCCLMLLDLIDVK